MTDEEKIVAIRARLDRWISEDPRQEIVGVAFALRHMIDDIAYIVGPE